MPQVSPARVTIVLPAYELAGVIYDNLKRVAAAFGLSDRPELVVVDDGSTDDTYREALRAAKEVDGTTVIRHDLNRGKGEALFTGARSAGGDVVVFLDADLDLPPEQLPAVLAQLGDADVLVGAKRKSMSAGRYPLPRRLLSRLFSFLTVGVFRLPVRETQTGLKILRRPVLDEVLPQMRIRGYAYDLEMLVRAHRAGYVTREVPVDLGAGASTAPLRIRMLWQMARDTIKLLWWVMSGKIPKLAQRSMGGIAPDRPTNP
ncbi:MAG TPA: glycosyltransferase family 2 protein [Acidimicrobiia bacterium]|jgi:glycosyltransferase involved in cell wall biosynthesis